MKCPVCHQGEMVSGIKDIPYTFRGRKTVLKGIHGLYCVHCEESIMQKEASEIFGGGVNAFSRYEKGNAQPHPSTIKLLRVLDKHPELLNEIR